jgi:hypothetical protein
MDGLLNHMVKCAKKLTDAVLQPFVPRMLHSIAYGNPEYRLARVAIYRRPARWVQSLNFPERYISGICLAFPSVYLLRQKYWM